MAKEQIYPMSTNSIVRAIADYKNFDWDNLCSIWNKFALLNETPQDPKYHAEGDVGTHTKWVAEVLLQLWEGMDNCEGENCEPLTHRQKEILFTATLLHDIAKPNTTKEIDGEIRSPGHSKLGERLARELLSESDYFSYDEQEQICKLIRYHGLPVWLLDKNDMFREVAKTSILCNNRMLEMLASADVTGRECDDKNEMIDRVKMFGDFCRERECFKKPLEFENNIHRFTFFNMNKDYHYVPYDDLGSTVYLMVGLPGSGKDTYIDENMPNIPEISLDDIRKELDIDPEDEQGKVIQEAKRRTKTFLAHEEDFVYNATNTTKMIRDKLRRMFVDYNARIHIVYINVTRSEAQEQNDQRHYKDKVPSSIINSLYRSLDPPTELECHELKIV